MYILSIYLSNKKKCILKKMKKEFSVNLSIIVEPIFNGTLKYIDFFLIGKHFANGRIFITDNT